MWGKKMNQVKSPLRSEGVGNFDDFAGCSDFWKKKKQHMIISDDATYINTH